MYYAVGVDGEVYASGQYKSMVMRELQNIKLTGPVMVSQCKTNRPIIFEGGSLDDLDLEVPMIRGTWTEEDDAYLIDNFSALTHEEIGEHLLRTTGAVSERARLLRKAGKLADPKKKNHKPWTEEEIQYLRDNHGKVSFKVMAETLDRTFGSVTSKVDALRNGRS